MEADPERLRDILTVAHLLAYARSIDPGAEPISYQRDWWDGSATAGCLLVEIGGRRRRVVSTGADDPAVLPAQRTRARRALCKSRMAMNRFPLPATRPDGQQTFVDSGDYVVCGYADCGGIRPLGDQPANTGCPLCGRR